MSRAGEDRFSDLLIGAVSKFWKRLKGGQEGAAVDSAGASSAREPVTKTIEQLKIALDGAGLESKNAIHVIDLSTIRESFGDRWNQMEKKADWVARQILERRLTGTDMFTEAEGPAYLIVFGQLTFQEAELKAALIAEEIGKRVVGDQKIKQDLRVKSGIGHVGDRTWIEESKLDKVKERITGPEADTVKHDALEAAGNEPKGSEAPSEQKVFASGRGALSSIDGEGSGLPQKQYRTTRGANYTVVPDGVSGAKLVVRSSPAEILKQSGTMVYLEPGEIGRQADTERFDLSEIRYVYRPLWNVRRKVVLTCACQPARFDDTGKLEVRDILPEDAAFSDLVDLDVLTIQKAQEGLARLLSRNHRLLISFPLHFRALAAPEMHRRRLLTALSEIPREFTELLIGEMVEIPEGTPASRITDIISMVKPHVNQIVLELDIEQPDFLMIAESGVRGISVDLASSDWAETELFVAMEHFARRVDGYGLTSYVHGLPSLSLLSAAVSAGFDFVDGDAVLSIEETPEAARRFNLKDIYAEIIDLPAK